MNVSIFYALVVLLVFIPLPAHAYLDPSVMSYTVQAIAGVLIALGAVASIIWRIVKKRAQSVLNIDLEEKKEVEPDVVSLVAGNEGDK